MKKRFSLVFVFAFFLLAYISCKSSPPPEPAGLAPVTSTPSSGTGVSSPETTVPSPETAVPSPETTVSSPEITIPSPITQLNQDSLTESIAKADEARKRATDFGIPDYFPSEWDDAESQYASAADMPGSNQDEIDQASAAYNAVADAYDDLLKKAIPLYAQAVEDEILSARDELISTGFTSYFPEYLQSADEKALAALDQYEAGDYYKAKDTAAEALNEYETLNIGAKIFSTRQEIIDRGFTKYDSQNFDKADEVTQTAMNEYEAGNKASARTTAEEALLRYNVVLTNGWTAYTAERRASAVLERELALAEKVNIASRDSFRDADSIFNWAEESFVSKDFKTAAVFYTDSEALFSIARRNTAEKRQRAMDAIRMAEEKIEESNETAVEAGRIIEGVPR